MKLQRESLGRGSAGRAAAWALLLLLGSIRLCAADQAALADVLKLKSAGMSDETITTFVANQHRNYQLSADDLVSLKAQGFSPAVIQAMLASGGGAASAPVAPMPSPPAATVTVPSSPAPAVAPPAAGPDVRYFYQELSPYGRWLQAEDGQWYWQPNVAVRSTEWRPYWDDGHWVHSDHGWYWSSDYPWGWAAFHYGRWRYHPHHGWLWLPDRVWGPAWVVWRTGDDYAGWAPLPPGAVYDAGSSAFLYRGVRVAAGFEFGLTWSHFTFCPIRDLGDTTLHRRFRHPEDAQVAFARSTPSARYSSSRVVVGGEWRDQFVNHGVAPERVAALRGRPLQPVHIQDLHTPSPRRNREHLDERTHTLEVYRPHGEPGR